MAQVQYQAVGRRKKAIARVRLIPGEGKIVINGRDIDNYLVLRPSR
jgi:small subunit ribosomal protein S9